MPTATRDRGEIVHFAGRHALSPALDAGGAPAFSGASGDGLRRCGWERFFHAVEERRLALATGGDDPAAARFVPAAEAEHAPSGGVKAALEHSRRLWKALSS